LGNFDKQVEGEKKEKIGGKRKFNALFAPDSKAEQNQILDMMSSKNPKLDKNRAAEKIMAKSSGDNTWDAKKSKKSKKPLQRKRKQK